MIERTVRSELGARKVAEITYTDIDRLHRKMTKASARKKTGGPICCKPALGVAVENVQPVDPLGYAIRQSNPRRRAQQ
jgi:hypothetical protein